MQNCQKIQVSTTLRSPIKKKQTKEKVYPAFTNIKSALEIILTNNSKQQKNRFCLLPEISARMYWMVEADLPI